MGEFPGLVKWKEVPKESAEGRARQEKWRRDSVILGELQKRGRRVTNVDQLVTDLEEVLVVKSDPKVLRCSSTKMRRSAMRISVSTLSQTMRPRKMWIKKVKMLKYDKRCQLLIVLKKAAWKSYRQYLSVL